MWRQILILPCPQPKIECSEHPSGTFVSCRDVDAVLSRANATEFGLASGVFTRDINKALYVSDKLQAGTVFVNTYNKTDVAAPFGGFKQSGFGKDLGNQTLSVGLLFSKHLSKAIKNQVLSPVLGCHTDQDSW